MSRRRRECITISKQRFSRPAWYVGVSSVKTIRWGCRHASRLNRKWWLLQLAFKRKLGELIKA